MIFSVHYFDLPLRKACNNKLYNVSKLGFYKNISVPDILNSEKGVSNKSSQRLKNMLLGIPLKTSSKNNLNNRVINEKHFVHY